MPWLECVPNVSEGRRPETVAALARAAASPAGVALLDVSSDPDHNRTVLTLAGEPGPLHAALLALYETALGEIDLTLQRGVHPRIGAVDVVPFVPLAGAEMADAVAAALRLAEAVAVRFDLPVYLYEEAARRPERRRLPDLRRGGFEGLPARLADPAWAPDFGPPRPHPTAGGTIVGARPFLIAFNVVLETDDPTVARRIAARVRERTAGGLPAVRAIGVYLESRRRAQVSMNLLDFRRTSLAAALARVRREAEALGTGIVGSEIVGLVPEAAVLGALR
ncbi:MAG TPA: glutamate formimidoyltransferase, partial [Thermoanaerobaculia bacterium]